MHRRKLTAPQDAFPQSVKSILGRMTGALLAVFAGVPQAAVAQAAASREVTPRGGLPNVMAKLEKGEEVRVVFLGGSITRGGGAGGYVAATEAWLKSQWPNAKVTVFNAGVSGTDSAFGAKRYDRDVLVHRPDLVLIEFAVNDGDRDHTQHMERIVHKTWMDNPECDLLFFYTLSKGHLADYQAGRLPRAASFHEVVAEHYGIPTLGLAHAVAAKLNAGEIEWSAFANDAVHPHAEGYQLFNAVFLEHLPGLLAAGTQGPHRIKEPLTSGLEVYPPALKVEPIRPEAFVSATGEKALESFTIPVPALHWIENGSYTTDEGKTLWRLHWMDKKRSGIMDETTGATKADWAKNEVLWFAEDKSFTGPEGNALFFANDKGINLGFSGTEVAVLVFVAPETGRYAFRLSVGTLHAWKNEDTEFALNLLRFGWGREQGESLFHYRIKRKDAIKAGHEGELELTAGEEIAMVVGSNSPGFIRGSWQNLILDIGRMAPK